MHHPARPLIAMLLAAGLIVYPPAAEPVLPIAAMLGKEVLKNIIMGELKTELFGALSRMGCKGAAIAGAVATASTLRPSPGGLPRIPGGGMAGQMPLPAGTPTPGSAAMPGSAIAPG